MSNWVIVGGCPRSGTTLLNFILNTHKNIGITNEVSIFHLCEKIGDLYFRERQLADSTERKKTQKENWKQDEILELIPKKNQSSIKILTEIYKDTFPEKKEIKWFGDKFPKYYQHNYSDPRIPLRNIKYIHITRDPILAINSMLRRAKNTKLGVDTWKGASTIEDGINEWISAWNYITSIKDDTHLHLKYEDLIKNPIKTISLIANFLEVNQKYFSLNRINNQPDCLEPITSKEISKINFNLESISESWHLPIESISKKHPNFKLIETEKKGGLIALINSLIKKKNI